MTESRKVGGSAGNRGKGRKKGVPNKTTAAFKEALVSVYADLQAETGKEHGHFLAWARDNSTEFYKLSAKLIPLQVDANVSGQLDVVQRRIV